MIRCQGCNKKLMEMLEGRGIIVCPRCHRTNIIVSMVKVSAVAMPT